MIKTWAKHVADYCNGGHVEISEDNVTSSFIHPGLQYKHFDRDGNPDIVDVMRFVNEIRNISLLSHNGPNGINHLDFLELLRGRLIFVMSTDIEITREFYDRNIPKWPVKATNSLSYLGNSSLTVMVKVSTSEKDIPLITMRSSYALVDKETRKSKPFPEWYKSKYSDKGLHSKPCRVETLNKPSNTFHSQSKVVWTDTDRNNHTNFATYVHYSINTLRTALRLQTLQQQQHQQEKHSQKVNNSHDQRAVSSQGVMAAANIASATGSESNSISGLRGINQDIVQSGVKNVRICFSKESVEGDLVDVYLWQEEGDNLRVKAVVERGADTLCHIHLEYFGTAVSHL